MTISTAFYQVSSSDLEGARPLIKNAQGETTFWGGRVITTAHHQGSISIDEVANKILNIGLQKSRDDTFSSAAERMAGIHVLDRLRLLYQETDEMMKNRNCLTRFFNWIREHTFAAMFTVRGRLQEDDSFHDYSREGYQREFGKDEFEKLAPTLKSVTRHDFRFIADRKKIQALIL